MKRFAATIGLIAALAVPGSAMAFHHGGLPARFCHAEAAGDPSNENGMADEAIREHNRAQTIPLPPVGTPGNGKGQGEEHCANAPAH